MNLLNTKISKKIIAYCFKYRTIAWFPYAYKYLPSDWKDIDGNNLFHWAAYYQNKDLFFMAVNNGANINHINEFGLAPIHKFIEGSFTVENEKVIFNYDESLLNLFLSNGVDVNQYIDYEKRNKVTKEEVYFFSKSNILGSPMELLISVFWEKVCVEYEEIDEKQLEKYKKMYNALSKSGANINLLKEAALFYDVKTETTIDAMQVGKSLLLGHFFARYVRSNNDLKIIRPLLEDPRLDYSLQDTQGNTLLHILLANITKRYNKLNKEKVVDMLSTIFANPSFRSESLFIKNLFNLDAIGCLKDEAKEYRTVLENLILKQNLQNNLKLKSEIKTKRTKI